MNPRGMLNWFLSPSFDKYNMSEYDMSNVAKMICSLKHDDGKQNNSTYNHIAVSDPDIELFKKTRFLEPIAKISEILNQEASPHIKHFLLHGSLADLKYIQGWSDLDTWVIIDDIVFSNPDSLVGLRHLFCRLNALLLEIDSIAHHGYIIMLKSDLDNYIDSFLPVEVLHRAISLYGKNDVYIRKSDTKSDWISKVEDIKDLFINFSLTGEFRHHPYMGEYLTETMISRREGMYQLKYLIGLTLSIPVIYYSAIGSPIYKADSFALFFNDFPASEPLLKCFSDIRTMWGSMEHYPYSPNQIPDWLMGCLPSDYVSQIIRLVSDILDACRANNREHNES